MYNSRPKTKQRISSISKKYSENFERGIDVMSYGTPLAKLYRQMGKQAGKVLKGRQARSPASSAEHHVRATLGLTVPPSLLATADEVIE